MLSVSYVPARVVKLLSSGVQEGSDEELVGGVTLKEVAVVVSVRCVTRADPWLVMSSTKVQHAVEWNHHEVYRVVSLTNPFQLEMG
jgi:hypothetical protein